MKTDRKQTRGKKATGSLCREKKTFPQIINILRELTEEICKRNRVLLKEETCREQQQKELWELKT